MFPNKKETSVRFFIFHKYLLIDKISTSGPEEEGEKLFSHVSETSEVNVEKEINIIHSFI